MSPLPARASGAIKGASVIWCLALLVVSCAGASPRAEPSHHEQEAPSGPSPVLEEPPPEQVSVPQEVLRAADMHRSGKCEELLAWIDAEASTWILRAYDRARLASWAAQCHERLGRSEEARELWRAVVFHASETGIADHARARLEGRRWSPPKLVGVPYPEYPREAVKLGHRGVVLVVTTVASDGSVSAVRTEGVMRAGMFDRAIVQAFQQGKFEPALLDGKPVAARYDKLVHFRFR